MKLNDIVIDNEKTLGKHLLLTEVIPYYRYNDGKKTNEIEGYKYTVVLQERKFEKLSVKIEGDCRMSQPDKYQEVELKGLELRPYSKDGDFAISAKATDIYPLKGNNN